MSSLFFLTNIYLSKSELYSIETPIVKKWETIRYHHFYVKVNINGFEKNIPVPNKKSAEIDNANFIVLTLNDGFWGFPFVVNKELKKD